MTPRRCKPGDLAIVIRIAPYDDPKMLGVMVEVCERWEIFMGYFCWWVRFQQEVNVAILDENANIIEHVLGRECFHPDEWLLPVKPDSNMVGADYATAVRIVKKGVKV